MTDAINYYARNAEIGEPYQTLWGYTYLGPVLIPPVPTTFGMTDRAGTGFVYYLMWDGIQHLVLTDMPPRPFINGQGRLQGQDTVIFDPWAGPYLGASGVRLGVTTAAMTGLQAGPHLQYDFPAQIGGSNAIQTNTATPNVIAPNINGPQQQTYPESTGFPTSQPPIIPGIPSSSPVPTGGGLAAFITAFATNTPPLVLAANLAGTPGVVLSGWHLQHYGA